MFTAMINGVTKRLEVFAQGPAEFRLWLLVVLFLMVVIFFLLAPILHI